MFLANRFSTICAFVKVIDDSPSSISLSEFHIWLDYPSKYRIILNISREKITEL